jgi:hypothetical protein
MLAPLMRDERSEFKSLLGCYDTKEKVPDDYAPHLFLFGIDVQVYEKIKETIRKIDEYASELRARFKRS